MTTRQDCGCGCGGTKECTPHTLVRPRFFCGQLLTDADLSTLTDWALDRRRLAVHREGWGAVCGLDVGADPEKPAGVVVRPGIAVSPCGEDIVLPALAKLDLTPCCPDLTSPCATLDTAELPDTCAVDIGVVYREHGVDPVLALGRSACGEAGECEDSRIAESFELVCQAVVAGSEPEPADWSSWRRRYSDAVSLVQRAVDEGLPGKASEDDLRRWLLARLRERPTSALKFVDGWVAESSWPSLSRFVELLYWISQDRIISLLSGECASSRTGERVPLARAWLARVVVNDRQQWVVRAIEPVAPHRKPFDHVEWPAPLGRLNLGGGLWHRPEDAHLVLQRGGVAVTGVTEWAPSTLDEVVRMISEPPLVSGGDSVEIRYVAMPDGAYLTGQRVVGYAPSESRPTTTRKPRTQPTPKPTPKPGRSGAR
jgi:hypothetical protein